MDAAVSPDPGLAVEELRRKHAGLRRARRVYARLGRAGEVGSWTGGAMVAGQAASDLIRTSLERPEPAMIARLGAAELGCVANYLGIRSRKSTPRKAVEYVQGRSAPWWWEPNTVTGIVGSAGVFPATVSALERFSELMLETMPSVDVLGSWLHAERLVAAELADATRVRLRDLEPYYHDDPWSSALEGKTVLVVHPFVESIRRQYARRELLFANPRILPEFELKLIPAVQSMHGMSTPFASWFDALRSMQDEVAAADFDIAILGCGAYGFPLAAHIKTLGKHVVHLGGATQILFGIKGARWDAHPVISGLHNEHWIRPTARETPTCYREVEGGCYW